MYVFWVTKSGKSPPTAVKKARLTPGKKRLAHRCYALHDNQEYTGDCFCTGESRTFWTAVGRFFYRCGGWRHSVHDGGDGGDGTEENSFSDGRHRHPRQGEAAIRHTAFCIYFITLAGAINSGKWGYWSPPFLSFSWGRVQWASLYLHLIIYIGGGSMEKSQTRRAFSLNCVQLALTLNNLGCVSTIQVEKACAFSLNCVQLALTFNNLGCVSTIQVEKTMFFLWIVFDLH